MRIFLALVSAAVCLPLHGFSQDRDITTRREKVISAHVGDDDVIENTFTYSAPPNTQIESFQLAEVSKFGDASYSPTVSPDQRSLTVRYKLQSHRIRGPFNAVIDTKTAQLDLDLIVTLRDLPMPVKDASHNDSIWGFLRHLSNDQIVGLSVAAISLLLFLLILLISMCMKRPTEHLSFVLRIALAISASGMIAIIPGFFKIQYRDYITAGGAVGIFVMIYLVNPAKSTSHS